MWDTGSKVEFKDFEMNLGNNVKCFHIALALWIIALVPLGFSETFPDRPAASDLNDIMALGTECVRGVKA